ncbi:solute carrier family 25 member 40-like [Camellia sinensis]|uniref:solute carrier family 25 member 40-like n=1 Tax=Camellia sinensis TaxID=4442 RepID=UPI001036E17A|nr:solute carrier family 25 member 40-like [Camellia sinensis]
MAVQGVSAAMAGGVSALITMPLDTIKTRLQVLDGDENNNGRKGVPTMRQAVRNLVREGGWMACYRGLGPRWAYMSMSATTMITTYEFLKRLSAKTQEGEEGLNWLRSGGRSRQGCRPPEGEEHQDL